MIVDTNIAVRHLIGVPEEMASRATALLDGAARLLVFDLVVAECVFVLESFYEWGRPQIADAMRSLVAMPGAELEDPGRIRLALGLYERWGIGFADACLAAIGLTSGAPVLSFDRDLDRVPGLERVEP